jgi:hypothetical protein
MSRNFERAAIAVPAGRPMPAYLIRCSKCGETEKVSSNTHGGAMAPEGIASRFRNKGWSVSTRDGGDMCPKCQVRKKASPEKESNVVEMKIKAEPPREMSKEDQRIIFAEINDVYVDEKTGYSSGWNDKKVAEKLGVPLAWVKGVREAHFGKEGAYEDFSKFIGTLRSDLDKLIGSNEELIKRSIKIEADAKSLRESAEAAHAKLIETNRHILFLGKDISK